MKTRWKLTVELETDSIIDGGPSTTALREYVKEAVIGWKGCLTSIGDVPSSSNWERSQFDSLKDVKAQVHSGKLK